MVALPPFHQSAPDTRAGGVHSNTTRDPDGDTTALTASLDTLVAWRGRGSHTPTPDPRSA